MKWLVHTEYLSPLRDHAHSFNTIHESLLFFGRRFAVTSLYGE